MQPQNPSDRLRAIHQPDAIEERLSAAQQHSYLADGVLGAIDGAVTTFAIVSGVMGGDLPGGIAVMLGVANLLADGFSMAVSNYQSTRSERERVDQVRKMEAHHIDTVPEGEREEVRQIFRAKGFDGELLEQIVEVITGNRQLWIDTMVTEEHGLALEAPSPIKAGVVTFVAFLIAGSIPLVPFLFYERLGVSAAFTLSSALTGAAFLAIGLARGHILRRPLLRSGLSVFFTGGAAASVAYFVGVWLREAYGVG